MNHILRIALLLVCGSLQSQQFFYQLNSSEKQPLTNQEAWDEIAAFSDIYYEAFDSYQEIDATYDVPSLANDNVGSIRPKGSGVGIGAVDLFWTAGSGEATNIPNQFQWWADVGDIYGQYRERSGLNGWDRYIYVPNAIPHQWLSDGWTNLNDTHEHIYFFRIKPSTYNETLFDAIKINTDGKISYYLPSGTFGGATRSDGPDPVYDDLNDGEYVSSPTGTIDPDLGGEHVLRIQRDVSGRIRVWLDQTRVLDFVVTGPTWTYPNNFRIGTPSHPFEHHFRAMITKDGSWIPDTQYLNTILPNANQIWPRNQKPSYPYLEGVHYSFLASNDFNTTTNVWDMSDEVAAATFTGGSGVAGTHTYQWYYYNEDIDGASTAFRRHLPFIGATTPTLDRDDYNDFGEPFFGHEGDGFNTIFLVTTPVDNLAVSGEPIRSALVIDNIAGTPEPVTLIHVEILGQSQAGGATTSPARTTTTETNVLMFTDGPLDADVTTGSFVLSTEGDLADNNMNENNVETMSTSLMRQLKAYFGASADDYRFSVNVAYRAGSSLNNLEGFTGLGEGTTHTKNGFSRAKALADANGWGFQGVFIISHGGSGATGGYSTILQQIVDDVTAHADGLGGLTTLVFADQQRVVGSPDFGEQIPDVAEIEVVVDRSKAVEYNGDGIHLTAPGTVNLAMYYAYSIHQELTGTYDVMTLDVANATWTGTEISIPVLNSVGTLVGSGDYSILVEDLTNTGFLAGSWAVNGNNVEFTPTVPPVGVANLEFEIGFGTGELRDSRPNTGIIFQDDVPSTYQIYQHPLRRYLEKSFDFGSSPTPAYQTAVDAVSVGAPDFDWPLNGDVVDRIGAHVTTNNGATFSTGIIPAADLSAYQAAVFGSGDNIVIDNDNLINTSAQTARSISLWFNATATGGWQNIYEEGGGTHGWHVALYDDYLTFNITQSGTARTSIQHQIVQGQTYHVVAVFDFSIADGSDNMFLYVNGAEVGTAEYTQTETLDQHTGDVQLGEQGDGQTIASDQGSKTATDYAGSIQWVTYWSEERVTAIDALALYLAGGGTLDVTAPVLTLATGTETGSTTASGTVTTDEGNGTLYYYASTNTSETELTIKGSGSSQAVSSTGVQNVSFTGLTASTTYYAHYVQDDAVFNTSNVISSSSFTTDAAAGFANEIYLNVGPGGIGTGTQTFNSKTIQNNGINTDVADITDTSGSLTGIGSTWPGANFTGSNTAGLNQDGTDFPANAWRDACFVNSGNSGDFRLTGFTANQTIGEIILSGSRDLGANDGNRVTSVTIGGTTKQFDAFDNNSLTSVDGAVQGAVHFNNVQADASGNLDIEVFRVVGAGFGYFNVLIVRWN